MGQALVFYKKRLLFIVIPYVLWSGLYYLFNQLAFGSAVRFDPLLFLKLLLWGDANYHLYFMAIIIQLYIVFPLLMGIVRWLRFKAWHVAALGLAVQGAFLFIHYEVHAFEKSATLVWNYFAVFGIGAAIGMRYGDFAERWKHAVWTGPLALLTGFLYMLCLLSAQAGALYPTTLYNLLYNVYAALIGISLIWASKLYAESKTRVLSWLLALGSASFGIYFLHPAIQTIMGKLLGPKLDSPYYHVYQLLLFVVMLGLSLVIVRLTRRIKLSWLLWGK